MTDESDILAQGPGYCIRRHDVYVEAVRSSGPGGQNVNKVATKVVLHFSVTEAGGLSDYVRKRLLTLFASQVTVHGDLVLTSDRHRSQHQNRLDVVAKLAALLRQAAARPRPRVATTPSRAAKERRLQGKRHRSGLKQTRHVDGDYDD